MSHTITLNGQTFGTGLKLSPQGNLSAFPLYADSGPMLTMKEIIDAAKSGDHKGRTKFDHTWVKNQGQYGSCNGWMIATMIAKGRVRRGLPRVDLSGAYAYSLMNGGRDQGSTLDQSMACGTIQGIATLDTVPADRIYRHQYDKAKADAEAKQYKAFECYTARTEQEIFSGLVCGFDCGLAVHAGNNFMRIDRGIAGSDNGPGNHAVAADGCWYDEELGELVADTENSWGRGYGENGRMGMTWKRHQSRVIQYHPFYLMRSTL